MSEICLVMRRSTRQPSLRGGVIPEVYGPTTMDSRRETRIDQLLNREVMSKVVTRRQSNRIMRRKRDKLSAWARDL